MTKKGVTKPTNSSMNKAAQMHMKDDLVLVGMLKKHIMGVWGIPPFANIMEDDRPLVLASLISLS